MTNGIAHKTYVDIAKGKGDLQVTTRFIATDLNAAARVEFERFIRDNARADVKADYSIWWDRLNFDDNGLHFELAGRYTTTGNPITIRFGLDECLLEEVED